MFEEVLLKKDLDLTRREFFTGLCSKDALKEVFGVWNSFSGGLSPKEETLTCEEAGLRLGRKVQKMNLSKISQRKEGHKI